MKSAFLSVLVLLAAIGLVARARAAEPVPTPRLVVLITVDGLPQSAVVQNRARFGAGGFKRFLDDGAWCADARYGHLNTYTAVGHATMLTGAYPYRHGVVGNDWLDRATGKRMYAVEDAAVKLLDEETKEHVGTSPRNLQVTTLGDELRLATGRRAKVVAISLKDRGAILLGGRLGMACWYSAATGRFITSQYYADAYPEWWQQFHARKPQDQWFGQTWSPALPAAAYACTISDGCGTHVAERGVANELPQAITGHETAPGPKYYAALRWTPFADEYTLAFAKAAVAGENLGQNPAGVPDLLAISFSAQDYISHLFGPESKQAQDNVLRLDRLLAELFAFLEARVGAANLLVALTADHGFANTPEFAREVLRLETGRADPAVMTKELNDALAAKFGPGQYVRDWWNPNIYLDYQAVDATGQPRAVVEDFAARWLDGCRGVHSVYTRSQLLAGTVPDHAFGRLASRSWNRQVSGDLVVIPRSGWYLFKDPLEYCSSHGSPWSYDTQVPLALAGDAWVKPGRYAAAAEVVDLAPTLACILDIRHPSGTEGRVLAELLR